MATKIVEHCRIAPPPGAPAEQSLKLLHFDMLWLNINPVKKVFFYKFKCSESHFLNTIVPSLKNSLSLTLKHFALLAGKMHHNNGMPFFRYVDGEDSAPLTIAISYADFENLTAYRSREGAELRDLVPRDSSTLKFSLSAFQVTLFPNNGVCIGLTCNHSLFDATTLSGFFRTWASINRSNGEMLDSLPAYDRDAIEDGDRLALQFWETMKAFPPVTPSLPPPPAGRVRATFVLSEAGIKTLKGRAFAHKIRHVSSFVVACAHLWTCLARSAAAAGGEVGDEELEYISCPVDCRRRLNPPLPDTYFGNCLTFAQAELAHGKLRGRDGFSSAVEAIREAIQGTAADERGILTALSRHLGMVGKRMIVVAGSPRLDSYGVTDYGWGRPVKIELLLDHTSRSLVFIGSSRDHRGGMEMALMMPKPQMDAFAAFFSQSIPAEKKLPCKM